MIFDLDGTLIDSFADIRQSLVAAFHKIDVELNESVLALITRGVGLEVFYDQALGLSHKDPDHAKSFQCMVETYRNHYAEHSANRPFEHAKELLEELNTRLPDITLAVATAKRSNMAEHVLQDAGLRDFFQVARGTDDLPHKPDPALLLEVSRLANVPPEHAAMVGDTDRDVCAAQAAKMTSIGIAHGGWCRSELETLSPCYVVDDLADLRRLMFEP